MKFRIKEDQLTQKFQDINHLFNLKKTKYHNYNYKTLSEKMIKLNKKNNPYFGDYDPTKFLKNLENLNESTLYFIEFLRFKFPNNKKIFKLKETDEKLLFLFDHFTHKRSTHEIITQFSIVKNNASRSFLLSNSMEIELLFSEYETLIEYNNESKELIKFLSDLEPELEMLSENNSELSIECIEWITSDKKIDRIIKNIEAEFNNYKVKY